MFERRRIFSTGTFAGIWRSWITAISFLCIPIKVEGRTAGALSCERNYVSDEQLDNDEEFLTIIGRLSRRRAIQDPTGW
jgi:GAF domain-containing protein